MAKPLSQIIYVNEPVGAAETISVDGVGVYFKDVGVNSGCWLQIRQVAANGIPTTRLVRNANKFIAKKDKYVNGTFVIRSSTDASKVTYFKFKKPAILKARTSYAITVIPQSNDPKYILWTATAGEKDKKTGIKAYFDTSTIGNFFPFTNDKV